MLGLILGFRVRITLKCSYIIRGVHIDHSLRVKVRIRVRVKVRIRVRVKVRVRGYHPFSSAWNRCHGKNDKNPYHIDPH